MYAVISRWEVAVANRAEFTTRALAIGEAARAIPGAVDIRGFYSEEGVAVIIMYFESVRAYESLYASMENPFAKAIEEQRLDQYGKWINSERGDLMG